MVLGELVPKNLAIAEPLATARAVVWIQEGLARALRLLISALDHTANAIVRRLGIEPLDELRSARTPVELGSLVRASGRRGTLDAATVVLMDRSLRFTDRVAEDLMTPRTRVVTLTVDDTLADLITHARRTGLSRFPVRTDDADTVLGAVHVKQAVAVPAPVRATTPLRDHLRPVPRVPQSLDGDALMTTLRGSGLQLAVVVDEYGGVAGIVTLEDVLEEIVGDVRDEHDRDDDGRDDGTHPGVRPCGADTWLVSGLLRGDEVRDAVGFDVPPGAYETLAGLVLARLGRIPDVDDDLVVDGWQLTVTRREGNRVAELRLHRPPGSPVP
jgi:CBS domain containing-hemolysin-like protein